MRWRSSRLIHLECGCFKGKKNTKRENYFLNSCGGYALRVKLTDSGASIDPPVCVCISPRGPPQYTTTVSQHTAALLLVPTSDERFHPGSVLQLNDGCSDNVQWPRDMAGTVGAAVGPQSPLNRNLERLLEEAQISGELRVSSRRLREFPKVASKYNLNDTVYSGKESPFLVTTFDTRCHSS